MGFVDFARIQQHQGVRKPPALIPLIKGSHCCVTGPADYPRLIELANAGSGLDRTTAPNKFLPMAEYVAGIDVGGQLKGTALLRRFDRGHIIGPVIAKNLEQAKR